MEASILVVAVLALFIVAVILGRAVDAPKGKWSLYEEATLWQKRIFFIYTAAGPAFWVGAWLIYGKDLTGEALTKYQHQQKLISDLWSAGAVFFALFWGLKKAQSVIGFKGPRS